VVVFQCLFTVESGIFTDRVFGDSAFRQAFKRGYQQVTGRSDTDNYKDAVLKAVNLGGDTDTTGAVTGGLAGLYYGYEIIPEKWIEKLVRRRDIEGLAVRLGEAIRNNTQLPDHRMGETRNDDLHIQKKE
jgi:hypothetical protein